MYLNIAAVRWVGQIRNDAEGAQVGPVSVFEKRNVLFMMEFILACIKYRSIGR
jgi:hypothetical protein